MSKPDDYDFYCDVALKPGADIKKVFENEHVLAFYHTKPYWEKHIVVIPKEHVWDLRSVDQDILAEIMIVIQDITKSLSDEENAKGVQVLTNLGKRQDTPHLHFHIGIGEKTK